MPDPSPMRQTIQFAPTVPKTSDLRQSSRAPYRICFLLEPVQVILIPKPLSLLKDEDLEDDEDIGDLEEDENNENEDHEDNEDNDKDDKYYGVLFTMIGV